MRMSAIYKLHWQGGEVWCRCHAMHHLSFVTAVLAPSSLGGPEISHLIFSLLSLSQHWSGPEGSLDSWRITGKESYARQRPVQCQCRAEKNGYLAFNAITFVPYLHPDICFSPSLCQGPGRQGYALIRLMRLMSAQLLEPE